MPKISELASKTSTITLLPGVQGTTTVKLTPAQLQAQFGLFTSSAGTRAAAVSASIDSSIQWLQTEGYAAIGDGGKGLYKKVVSAPAHSGYFQSADGAYWELQGPVVTLENFGAKGDSTTNDTTAITNAFSSAVTMTAKLLGRRSATYKTIGAVVDQSFTNVDFDGQGCTFLPYSVPVSNSAYNFRETSSHGSTTMRVNASPGDDHIDVNSLGSATAGDLVVITFTRATTANPHQFYRTVLSVSGTLAYIDAVIPPSGTVLTTDTNSISFYVAGQNGKFRNAIFDGTNMTADDTLALSIQRCIRGTIENLEFRNCTGSVLNHGGGLLVYKSQHMLVRNIRAYKCGSAGTSDIEWYLSTSRVENMHSHEATGFGLKQVFGDGNIVCGISSIKANGRGFKTQGTFASAFSNIYASNSLAGFHNVAIDDGTCECAFDNIVSVYPPQSGGVGSCVWLSDEFNLNNIFTNLVCKGVAGSNEIRISDANNTGNVFDGVKVTSPLQINNTENIAIFRNVNGLDYVPQQAITVANGQNDNLALPVSDFIIIKGATGAFSITGFTNPGLDGARFKLVNITNQALTIKNNTGSSTGNKINTISGSDLTNILAADFVYEATTGKWFVMSAFDGTP